MTSGGLFRAYLPHYAPSRWRSPEWTQYFSGHIPLFSHCWSAIWQVRVYVYAVKSV